MEIIFYVSNLQKVFAGTCLTNLDLSKTQPCKYFVNIWTKEIKAKSEEELRKQQ